MQLDGWVIAYIRVVPVEEQPVDSLQLVFPERIAVFIFSGTLGFLPVTGGRSLLFQIKQFPLVVSVQPQERGPLPSLAQHSKAKIKRGLEECQLLPRASALAHAPSLSRTPQSSLGRCQLLTPTCCPRRLRSTTLPGTKLQAVGTHINTTVFQKRVFTSFWIFWGWSDWHLHSSHKSFNQGYPCFERRMVWERLKQMDERDNHTSPFSSVLSDTSKTLSTST